MEDTKTKDGMSKEDMEEKMRTMSEALIAEAEQDKREFEIRCGVFTVKRGMDNVVTVTDNMGASVLMLRPNSPSYQLVGNADRLDKQEINGLNTYLTSIWIMLSTIDAQFTFDVIMMASKYVESCMKKADKLVKEGDDSHDADILKDEEEKFNMEKKIDADIAELDKTMKGKMQ